MLPAVEIGSGDERGELESPSLEDASDWSLADEAEAESSGSLSGDARAGDPSDMAFERKSV